tara:strand:+ start:5329 stop:5505 length:177 start_codon:yes stop_codon:yes gene_type:complete
MIPHQVVCDGCGETHFLDTITEVVEWMSAHYDACDDPKVYKKLIVNLKDKLEYEGRLE